MESILTSIKRLLGIQDGYDHFDPELIIHINSVFMLLSQLGVGPNIPFVICGKHETWDSFMPEPHDNELLKTFMYLRVRLLFDPPTNAFLVNAITDQIREFEWRLNIRAEGGIVNG